MPVRSGEKGRYLEEYFKPFGERLVVAVVEDISKVRSACPEKISGLNESFWQPGAFDEAVKGVDAIAPAGHRHFFPMSKIREVHFCKATTHPRDLGMLLCRLLPAS